MCEHLDAPESELLRRLRALVGAEIPIVVSLDLHANVDEDLVGTADGVVAYRTYPHVDMVGTGRRVRDARAARIGRDRILGHKTHPVLDPDHDPIHAQRAGTIAVSTH